MDELGSVKRDDPGLAVGQRRLVDRVPPVAPVGVIVVLEPAQQPDHASSGDNRGDLVVLEIARVRRVRGELLRVAIDQDPVADREVRAASAAVVQVTEAAWRTALLISSRWCGAARRWCRPGCRTGCGC